MLGIFTGELSFRRLGIILNHLPPESRFRTARYAAMTPDEKAQAALQAEMSGDAPAAEPRSQLEILTARTGDLIQQWMWSQADPKKRGKPPSPFFREEEPPKPVRASTVAFLQGIRERHAERQGVA